LGGNGFGIILPISGIFVFFMALFPREHCIRGVREEPPNFGWPSEKRESMTLLNALAPHADMEQWAKANERKQFAAYRCYQLLEEHLNDLNTSEDWEEEAKEWVREWQDAHNDTLAALIANRPPQEGGE
jgi:hypothetical protein